MTSSDLETAIVNKCVWKVFAAAKAVAIECRALRIRFETVSCQSEGKTEQVAVRDLKHLVHVLPIAAVWRNSTKRCVEAYAAYGSKTSNQNADRSCAAFGGWVRSDALSEKLPSVRRVCER